MPGWSDHVGGGFAASRDASTATPMRRLRRMRFPRGFLAPPGMTESARPTLIVRKKTRPGRDRAEVMRKRLWDRGFVYPLRGSCRRPGGHAVE